ncbi:transposase family protein [Nonomuraea rubra]
MEAACPACETPSRRVHSHYERRLSDTAVGGQGVLIHLRVHRFFLSYRSGGQVPLRPPDRTAL